MTLPGSSKHVEGQSPKLVALSATPTDNIYLEEASRIDDRLIIRGWFFRAGKPLSSAEVIVHSKTSRRLFSLNAALPRPDVRDSHDDDSAQNSGFSGTFRLDQAAGLVTHADLVFKCGPDGQEATYRIEWTATATPLAGIVAHTFRNLNFKDIRWAAGELLRGRVLSIWREMHKAYRSDLVSDLVPESTEIDLDEAIGLLHDDRPHIEPLGAEVDIVIPVYNGLEHLGPLFESLVRNTEERHRIILVDDCSPDPGVRKSLLEFQGRRRNVTVVQLTENLGFVGAANKGAELASGDFVLLNTDVVVPPLWLERLMAPFGTEPDVASVTPFSNAATICSFPVTCVDNEVFNAFGVELIDSCFQQVNAKLVDDTLPTSVGFCMAVRRQIWLEIGPFDRAAFKQGYGEENDWSQRAAARGYRNVICPNLYVYHKHGGSFVSATRAEYRARGYAEVVRRHPNYERDVASYIAADVLRPLRDVLAILVSCSGSKLGGHLIIDHWLGGGSNSYRDNKVSEEVARGRPVLLVLLRPEDWRREHPERFRLQFYFGELSLSFRFRDIGSLTRLLAGVPLEQIFLNSIVSDENPLELVEWIAAVKHRTHARLVVPFHDFYALCPSYTLLNEAGRFCDLPEEGICVECLRANSFSKNPRSADIRTWRNSWSKLIENADEVLCFSSSSRELVERIYPGSSSRLKVLPHDHTIVFPSLPRLRPRPALKIGVVGAIGFPKGAGVIERLARMMESKDPDAEIVVIGTLDVDEPGPNVRVLGPYQPASLAQLIEDESPSLFLMPSIWPETFSYVTQELINLNVPVAVFDIGAPAERVKQYAKGHVISLSLADDADALYRALAGLATEVRKSL